MRSKQGHQLMLKYVHFGAFFSNAVKLAISASLVLWYMKFIDSKMGVVFQGVSTIFHRCKLQQLSFTFRDFLFI